ncbi:hypothetical protein CEXT_739081 [Caerostris extrusa]|uniref:Uncharacterized protein n=1 Tax=Caerostris extrusa TaxID=172846 RepID=A0AAV4R5R6_CAEEX|nr:hypothetical protein CEXT_739081 [Caerostris extrusa]
MSNSRVHNKSWEEGNGNLGANLSVTLGESQTLSSFRPLIMDMRGNFRGTRAVLVRERMGHSDTSIERSKTRFSNGGGGREK